MLISAMFNMVIILWRSMNSVVQRIRFHTVYLLCFADVVVFSWVSGLIFPMYSGDDCPWRLMVGVNDLLYVPLECLVSL